MQNISSILIESWFTSEGTFGDDLVAGPFQRRATARQVAQGSAWAPPVMRILPPPACSLLAVAGCNTDPIYLSLSKDEQAQLAQHSFVHCVLHTRYLGGLPLDSLQDAHTFLISQSPKLSNNNPKASSQVLNLGKYLLFLTYWLYTSVIMPLWWNTGVSGELQFQLLDAPPFAPFQILSWKFSVKLLRKKRVCPHLKCYMGLLFPDAGFCIC